MKVGQPVIMQAANSEAQESTEDVMDDADVAGLAMGWMPYVKSGGRKCRQNSKVMAKSATRIEK